ncbi:MAG: T9SS type A sorting domain-containing protein [Taibaiella sp.]|nr:T9SS type A sorting domain-containing protein [Taibaiella sp.]
MYKKLNKFIKVLLCLSSFPALPGTLAWAQQYPGGVSSGTTRGYKVAYYNGSFSNVSTAFGAGTANATPGNFAYSNKISGTEFYNADDSYYGLEYTGILEIPVTGSYTIVIGNIDDQAALYINGALVASGAWTGSVGSGTYTATLNAGDVPIKVKYRNGGGAAGVTLRFTAAPAGSNITTPTDVDGRFVRYDGAKLTAWYKGENLTYSAGNVTGYTNMAPDFSGNGNLVRSGAGSSQSVIATLTNFNPGVRFDGDEVFRASSNQKGLSYRGATKSLFLVNHYRSNVGQSSWQFFHYNDNSNGTIGFLKSNSTSTQLAVNATGVSGTSTYTADEPKLLGGFVDQVVGGLAPSGTNPLSININGVVGTPSEIFSNVTAHANYGLNIGFTSSHINEATIPEAIYYPFKLSQTEERQVNTYLGVKYGISLTHDYLNTQGQTIFSQTTNTGYNSKIFGIGREDAQGLHQKQSQSQMVSSAGYDFLVASKGAIATTNALNAQTLPDGSYLLFGDNGVALASKTDELPTALITSSACALNRLTREWKVQSTGTPGAVTFRAGSATSGSFRFPLSASGIMLLVDLDGDGDFATGSYATFPASALVNGVATFDNVTFNNGDVFTFAWTVTSPGGVSNGLKLWTKADEESLSTGNVASWADFSPNLNDLTRTANSNVQKVSNQFNFNPAVRFANTDNQFLQSTSSLGMNGSNTHAEFYVLRGIHTSGLNFDEFITLGGIDHRWENSGVGAGSRYYAYGNGTAGALGSPTTGPFFDDLGLYSLTRDNAGAANFSSNGEIRRTTATPGTLSLSGNFRIGTDVDASDGNYASFWAPELIVYNATLTDLEIRRVNSYLGIKYSIPIADGSGTVASDYLSADGTIIWSSNATHKFGMFGIGRDDCSGLNQKQSKAYLGSTDNIVIGKGTIATTNEENTSAFTANKNFVVIGHDNGNFSGIANNSVAYATISCNPYRYNRTWKVKNTGSVTGLQMMIGNAANPIVSNWSNIALMIDADGDGDFTNATHIPASSLNNGVATFNNVTLPDGAVFTLAYTLGFPGGVSKPSNGTPIAGATYVNGLEYKLYSTNGTAGSIAAGFGAYSPTLLSTGYYNNATSFHAFVTNKIATNFGIELTGKLYVPTTSATYRFSGTGDDQLALIIDGNVLLNINGSPYSATTGDINLTAGYHDIIIRGREQGGGENFNLTWNGGSGGTYSAIPDVNFYVLPKGPSAWYMADDIALTASFSDGAIVTNWNDLGNGNNLDTYSGNPIYYNANKSFITNYHPSVYFTADWVGTTNYLNGFAYGRQGKSVFAVGSNNNAGGETIYSAYGIDATNGNFGITKLATGKLQLFGSSNTLTEAGTFYSTATITTDIISGYHGNGNIAGVGINAYLYANGLEKASASKPAWNTMLNDYGQIYIGAAPDYANTYWYNKNMNEIIYYPWDLSALERQKVNSYLAIKWGTTLDQSTPTNYIASDGSVIWNATTGGTFNNDITVIGRDDCGALNQKQSTSTDQADIISMGRANIVATNADNTNIFTADKNFISFAHNGQQIKSFNANLLPASLTSGTCYVKLDRVWQTQTKGSPGVASLELGSAKDFSVNRATYKPVLLVSNSGTDFSAATIVTADSVNRGKAYFSNVDFGTDATKYFTLAYINAAPGGIVSNLTAWYDAGADVFTDDALTTYAETSGELVAGINNVAFGATLPSLYQSTTSLKPVFDNSKFNYNPALIFDGSNDGLFSSSNTISSNDYRNSNTITSIVAAANSGTSASNQFVFWMHANSNSTNGKNGMELNQTYFQSSSTPLSRSPIVTVPELFSMRYTANVGWNNYRNLLSVGTGLSNITGTTTGPFTIGSYKTSYSGGLTYAGKFDMGEIIIYKDDKGNATTTPMRKIHSYLAVKYGYTLDASAMGGTYLASDATVTYNHTDYWNRITGIGRDDCSALEQRQSFSVETGALVKISSDPNGMAISNALNPGVIAADKSFHLVGDNGKALTWTGVDKVPGNLVRLNRVWQVMETGTIGTLFLQVPSSTSAASTKLPVADETPVYLLVSSTGNFTAPDQIIEMTPNGDDLSVSYDFGPNDYYTFAAKKSCIAPAGISDGLTSWYRADNKPTGALTALNDEAAKTNLVKFGTGASDIVGGLAANNYNRYLQLTSGTTAGSSFATANADQVATTFTSANVGTMYGVTYGTNKDRLFSVSRSNNNTLDMTNTANSPMLNNGTLATATYPAGIANVANTWAMSWDGSQVTPYTNGLAGSPQAYSTALVANSSHYAGIGGSYNGTNYTRSGIAFNEAFSYNRVLTTAERQVLNTYLALKYGQTLTHDYFSPAYNGSNAETTTIYSMSSYPNRVFGVGIDSSGCFSQNQATSVVPGNMLKMSVDGAITTENSRDMTKFTSDRTYVAAGDDNASIISWTTGTEVPAYYTSSSSSCVVPQRINREWKAKALNNDQEVLITVPDNSSTATTKLPALPLGTTKVFMIVNEHEDFTINAGQEEIPMTLNASTKEWEASYSFPAGKYKYLTFATKPDATALAPVAIATGSVDGTINSCDSLPYTYYKGTGVYANRAVLAINANGNTWSPDEITVDNQGTLTGGSPTFSNAGDGYYESNDGVNTLRITKRLHTVKAPGSYTVNGGVIVRIYYTAADLTAMQSDPFVGGATIQRQGWFKSPQSTAAATVATMTPSNIIAEELTPIASGNEKGVDYVEFLVQNFSTFGYFVKTQPEPLPVELINFSAHAEGCAVRTKWTTGTESNLSHFEVQNSTDGAQWSSVHKVNALGSGSSYQALSNVAEGKQFFRLKMQDNDGTFKYSNTIPVLLNCNSHNYTIYPNPTNEFVTVFGLLGGEKIEVFDYLGRSVQFLDNTSGVQSKDISFKDHVDGVYLIKIINKLGVQSVFKIVKN